MANELHCWVGEYEYIEQTFGFESDEMFAFFQRDECRMCMLPAGHEGPHDFMLTSEIVVTFKGAPDGQASEA